MPEQETHRLLTQINRKDRRYKFFQTLFIGALVILVGFLLASSRNTITEIRKNQVDGQQRADERNDVILRTLNCIALIQPEDRTEPVVREYVENAKIPDHSSASGESSINTPRVNAENRSNSSTAPSTTQSTTTVNNNVSPQPSPSSSPSQPTQPESKPVEIIGVPVCVPLTSLCLNQ